MDFSMQEYWSGLPFCFPGYLPDPGIEPGSLALQADSYCLSPQGGPENTVDLRNRKSKSFPSHVRVLKVFCTGFWEPTVKFSRIWWGGCQTQSLFFFFFFSFIFISWRLITLQYYSGFCHTLTWISHGLTCIPHPNPPSHLFKNIFYWSIVDLQSCVNFCCTVEWLSHTRICLLFYILFHYGLSQEVENHFLCFTVGPVVYPFWM